MQAMTHRSYLNEHPELKIEHNERLEFLGDAVLELVVTEYLYQHYPNPEGELTNWRASLVNANSLAALAGQLGIGPFLFLSKGETKDTGKARQFILANAFEALIGALYLDRGLAACRRFLTKHLIKQLPYIISHKLYLDPKSQYQEITQEKYKVTPNYKVLGESGPDHARRFRVGVFLDKKLITVGEGSSKQEAEVDAATMALQEEEKK